MTLSNRDKLEMGKLKSKYHHREGGRITLLFFLGEKIILGGIPLIQRRFNDVVLGSWTL